MQAILITFDQAYYERIIDMLQRNNCRGFTSWQEVQGSFSAPAGTFPLFFRLNCTGRVDWERFILT